MPKLHPSLTPAIKALSEKEKYKLLLRFARAHAEMHDVLCFELLEEVNLETLRTEAEENIHHLLFNLTGRSVYKGLSRAITKAQKEIARVKKITKNPQLEVDLLVYLINVLVNSFGEHFHNANRIFPAKVARLVLRLHGQILKNLHPDLRIEYKPLVDDWLNLLREKANRYPVVSTLPDELPE